MPSARRVVVVCMSVLLLLSSVPPVRAGWGWIEKLSGPGPFYGIESPDFPLYCPGMDGAKGFFCPRLGETDEGFFMFGLSYANLDARRNELQFPDGTTEAEKAVALRIWTLSLNRRLHPFVDLGVGVCWNRFSGPLFEDLDQVSYDLPRIIVRPLAFFGDRRVWDNRIRLRELIHFKFRYTYFPGPLTSERFGAEAGTWQEKGEWVKGASLGVSVTLIW